MTTSLTIWRKEFGYRWEAGCILGGAIYCTDRRPKKVIWTELLAWSSRNAKRDLEDRNRRFKKEQAKELAFALEHAKIPAPKIFPLGWGPIKFSPENGLLDPSQRAGIQGNQK